MSVNKFHSAVVDFIDSLVAISDDIETPKVICVETIDGRVFFQISTTFIPKAETK